MIVVKSRLQVGVVGFGGGGGVRKPWAGRRVPSPRAAATPRLGALGRRNLPNLRTLESAGTTPPPNARGRQATNAHTRDENRYGGTADAVARIWREEGPPGFYAGLRAKILQTAVNAGLMLALKDSITRASERALRAAARRGGGGGAGGAAAMVAR